MPDLAASKSKESQTARVYNIPSSYRWIGAIVMLVCSFFIPVILVIALANSAGQGNLVLVLAAIFLTAIFVVIGVVIYLSLVSARLAVGPGGISYFTAGGSIQAPWARVAGYGNLASSNRKGLILYQDVPSETPKPVSKTANTRSSLTSPRKVDPKRLIPLFPFDKNWQEGEIGQLIRHYAPHALKDLGSLNLADFDLSHATPDLPLPNPAPDVSVLAANPKMTRLDALIIVGNCLLTVWALALIFLQLK